MTKQVQRRRGTATQHTSFTGAEGEISVNTTNKSIHVHDGVTTGGIEAARADGANIAFTNDITWGDNDKAIFGAGSDLQIYHDGANNWVDAVSGAMFVRGSRVDLRGANNEMLLVGNQNGNVSLYYDNSAKLATTSTGIDVTGTVTADGLTVDGNTIFAGGSLGAAANSQSSIASGLSAGRLVSDAGTTNITAWNTTFNDDVIEISAGATASYVSGIAITPRTTTSDAGEGVTLYRRSVPALKVDGSGDISFYNAAGSAQKFFWDASAESLGLGTVSPQTLLHLSGGGNAIVRLENNSSSLTTNSLLGSTQFYSNDPSGLGVGVKASVNAYSENPTGSAYYMTFNTTSFSGSNDTERMRITSSGNVGIGTSSPETKLDVMETYDTVANILTNGTYAAKFTSNASGNAGRAQGILLGGTDSDVRGVAILGEAQNTSNAHDMIFALSSPSSTPTERMRIDSSGNLLVGTTAQFGAGLSLNANNTAYFRKSGDAPLTLRRDTSDGSLLNLYKDTAQVGSIGNAGANVYIGSDDVGLLFGGSFATPAIGPRDITGAADNDAAINLGWSTNRFKDLYLSGGVYLGGTGSANKLDDVEEGTWTPYLAGVTAGIVYSIQAGTYTKIGSVVTVSFIISISTAPTAGSNIRIPLPFNARGSSYTYMHGGALNILDALNLTADQKSQVRLSSYQSGTDFYFYNVDTGGVWNSLSTITTGSIAGSITYETA